MSFTGEDNVPCPQKFQDSAINQGMIHKNIKKQEQCSIEAKLSWTV